MSNYRKLGEEISLAQKKVNSLAEEAFIPSPKKMSTEKKVWRDWGEDLVRQLRLQ